MLGLVGNMATRLIRNGINVVGFDMSSEMVEA